MEKIGISGKIAGAFINSRLTPLLVAASLVLGIFAIIVTPREEEPQIIVPMFDVMVMYPGASAKEVEERVTRPMERLLYEINGVEYVYSITRPGVSMVIVRFNVGEDTERSLVKLYDKLMSNYDKIPPGVSNPLVKPKSIDEVPILTLTISGEKYDGYQLRQVAAEMANELKKDPNVGEITITGGQRRQLKVSIDPVKLRAYGISPLSIINMFNTANTQIPSGTFQKDNKEVLVETGGFLKSAEDVGNLVVGTSGTSAIYLKNIATITDGPEDPANYVFTGTAPAHDKSDADIRQAVTVSLAKKSGSNATTIAKKAIEKAQEMKGWIIPKDIDINVTRNYGESAEEKSNELLDHLMIATLSVIILIALTLGWKESIVVAVAVPVTLALTLLVTYVYGYTLNRVTLFSLIFSIGILVDDAIVVVENIHRHFKTGGASIKTAVMAVDEVGNPTILATFTVIAALLPMAFVSGLMGPYMRPIPVGASAAMIFSILIAFIVTPWMSYKVLRNVKHGGRSEKTEGKTMLAFYEKMLRPLIQHRGYRIVGLMSVAGLLMLTLLMLPLKLVTVKMLPFDNKSEIQIIIDMPAGTTLEQTAAATRAISEFIRTVTEVKDFQLYIGTAAPFNFNGLVRHYYLRQQPNQADIQINLVEKGSRKAQSHDVAKRIRGPIQELAKRFGANVKIAEIPPGPPVLSTLVAELYGPDPVRQTELAKQVKEIFENTPGVVDVDWFVEADAEKYILKIDKTKAAVAGVSPEAAASTLRVFLGGTASGLIHDDKSKEPVEIYLQAPRDKRSGINELKGLTVVSASGKLVALSELVNVVSTTEDKTIFHKNLRRVVYVVGDVAGKEESPAYAILKMKDAVKALKLSEGYELTQHFSEMPWLEKRYSLKWDGEWQITYDVFVDMGIAFGAVLILIYVLVVGWFKNFLTPVIIMVPIPLTLVGILPGHWIMGAFFTATSMIGFIALAGIIVRNSILLVDFIQHDWKESGNLSDAIIKAGAVRFMPISLTAAAVLVGSVVMLFDPIFQGLAISMMFGALSATLLTLIAVPLLYYEFYRNKECPVEDCSEG
ncbi:efflux RND transporter permease subunit [Candidatus Magnetominusculus xianensis]|uniref:Multidrug transporter AcrB n=1 Tax=Candidatus Magnetominusculus xianensis TaxID=1748249 RepID=A0ABR5SEU9_9BACT|nr:efflux RND transporter permease subunit [Candidatus Magnetominusculus xianensis]KWT82961.1 multidrug transporter AcrB [Candidatus Magnetominusculus xianensis]MBF0403040.1 efflux RND transporter permease subunit [Nitrospirota bacterium]